MARAERCEYRARAMRARGLGIADVDLANVQTQTWIVCYPRLCGQWHMCVQTIKAAAQRHVATGFRDAEMLADWRPPTNVERNR